MGYVLGHSGDELVRLRRQGALFSEPTREGLLAAGLASGMRVLDLGCGAGDVCVEAAKIVGPTGKVQGIDRSADAVATANRRLRAEKLEQAHCEVGDVFGVDLLGFDAVVGRFLLMHLPEPSALLARILRDASPGTTIVFLEMDISSASATPRSTLFDAGVRAICDVYCREGAEPDMGSKLFATFADAGMRASLRGFCRMEAGRDAPVFAYLAASIASLVPSMTRHGIGLAGMDPKEFSDALMSDAADDKRCVAYPRFVCAWARTSNSSALSASELSR